MRVLHVKIHFSKSPSRLQSTKVRAVDVQCHGSPWFPLIHGQHKNFWGWHIIITQRFYIIVLSLCIAIALGWYNYYKNVHSIIVFELIIIHLRIMYILNMSYKLYKNIYTSTNLLDFTSKLNKNNEFLIHIKTRGFSFCFKNILLSSL